jgi:predicted DNA-binding transcriptional regulator AlpA
MTSRATTAPAEPLQATGPDIPRLLWGWPQILSATGVPRRTLEREIVARRFPEPVKRIGRRPFWRPSDVVAWAQGGGRP